MDKTGMFFADLHLWPDKYSSFSLAMVFGILNLLYNRWNFCNIAVPDNHCEVKNESKCVERHERYFATGAENPRLYSGKNP